MIRSASTGPTPGSLWRSAAEAVLRFIGARFVTEAGVLTEIVSEVWLRGRRLQAGNQKMNAKETAIKRVRTLLVARLCFMYANHTL